jgi:hypothetical protein
MILVATALGVALPSSASASPSARIAYERAAGAESCPDEDALRTTVAARLGFDPFRDQDERTVRARITRSKGGPFRADLELVDRDGVSHGKRQLSSPSRDCDDVFLAMTLAIGIAIDPLHEGERPPAAPVPAAPAPAPPLAQAAAPVAAESPPRSPPTTDRVRFVPWAAALGSVGVVPGPSLGALVGVRGRWNALSLGVEGRWDASRSVDIDRGGTASAEVLSGVLSACVHPHALFGCLTGSLGSMLGSGSGVSRPDDSTTLYSMVGLRAGFEPVLVSGLHLHMHVEGDRTLTPTRLSIHGAEAWRSPAFSASLALGLSGVL